MIIVPHDDIDCLYSNPPFEIKSFEHAYALELLICDIRNYWRKEKNRDKATKVMKEIRKAFEESKSIKEFSDKIVEIGEKRL
jgi:hypothetical protein